MSGSLISESYFKRTVLNKLKAKFYLHNNVVLGNQNGVPDTFIEGVNSDLWIEFKVLRKKIILKNETINLSPLASSAQNSWIVRRDKTRNDALFVIGFVYETKIMVYKTTVLDQIDISYLIKNSMSINKFVSYVNTRLSSSNKNVSDV